MSRPGSPSPSAFEPAASAHPSPAASLRRSPAGPFQRSVVLTAVAAAVALNPAAASAAAKPAPTVLDATPPLDLAATGATAAWLRPLTAGGTRTALIVRDGAGAAPRVVGQTMPAHASEVTIGTDAQGVPTAVVATESSSLYGRTRKERRRGELYALPLDGSAAPHRLAVSTPGTDLHAPGLFRGTLSFSRHERLREGWRWTVRVGSLAGASSKLVSRTLDDVTVTRSTPTAGGRVAYATVQSRAATGGGIAELRLLKPGQRSARVSQSVFGGASECGFGPLVVSPDGRQLSASRWTVAGAHPHDFSTWTVPGSQLLSTEKSRVGGEIAVPMGDEGRLASFGEYSSPGEGVMLIPPAS